MIYQNTESGRFVSRPNRFIAKVILDRTGAEVVCHVKNTGRCRELLIPGTVVVLEHHPGACASGRKTEYSLIGVWKKRKSGVLLINMDSQAPNAAAKEWLEKGGIGNVRSVRREVTFGRSRFDLAFELPGGKRAFIEVKGVTLERDGTAMFPDAPTKRGVKHIEELIFAVSEGYEAYLLFVIQMKGISSFTPNMETHPEFGEALCRADRAGVHLLAVDCLVRADQMEIDKRVAIVLPSPTPSHPSPA